MNWDSTDRTSLHQAAIELYRRGWPPLPLGGLDGKRLLETQITGYSPNDANLDEIRFWPNKFDWRNIGVRCPIGVVGLDVDDYESNGKSKCGLTIVADHERRFGAALPKTYISTARTGGSGIRWYRVPDDWQGPSHLRDADGSPGDVELIQRHHRYAVVPPSIHYTGAAYQLYGPDGSEADGFPQPGELPLLPSAWCDGLAALSPAKASRGRFNREQIELWLDTYTGDEYTHGLPQVVKHIHSQVDSGQRNRHDAMLSALCWALKEVRVGAYPGREAERVLRAEWLAMTADDPNHDEREFDDMLGPALNAAEDDDHAERWLRICRDYGTDTREYEGAAEGLQLRRVVPSDQTGTTERNTPLDLRQLRTEPPQPISWLLPDVLARDSYVSLSAAPGTGKSLITRAIAVDASLGRSAFDPSHPLDPAKVIYLDAENGQDWWRCGLDAMGAPLDLPNLAVLCYPDIGGLDTPKGAKEFHALMQSTADGHLGGVVDLIVLDTVSRFIDGGENDADTWSQFYRLAIQPLRDQQVAVLRLDHLGKDADKGPRGSSHKLSDVDADFRMTAARAGSDDLTLALGKRRRQHFAQVLSVKRRDSPLRHELNSGAASFVVRNGDGAAALLGPDVRALVADLDRLSVEALFGRDNAKLAYKRAGGPIEANNSVWTAAVKFRKERAKQPKSIETEPDSDADGSTEP